MIAHLFQIYIIDLCLRSEIKPIRKFSIQNLNIIFSHKNDFLKLFPSS